METSPTTAPELPCPRHNKFLRPATFNICPNPQTPLHCDAFSAPGSQCCYLQLATGTSVWITFVSPGIKTSQCGSSTGGKAESEGWLSHPTFLKNSLPESYFLYHTILFKCKKARLLLDMDMAGIYLASYISRGSISPRLCSPFSLHHRNQDQSPPIPVPLAGSGHRQ